MAEQLYRDYFNIDPKYFPAVTADLVASGEVSWKRFYPHETFVDLLKTVHAVLSGKTPRSIWVEGAYGTGKSHAALTVKSLLEASDDEVRAYFDEFELDKDLCEKFLTAKNAGKVLVIHRMGSSSICSDSDLIWAIQESIDRALSERGIENRAEGTLKDAALRWLEDADHRDFLGKKMALKKTRVGGATPHRRRRRAAQNGIERTRDRVDARHTRHCQRRAHVVFVHGY